MPITDEKHVLQLEKWAALMDTWAKGVYGGFQGIGRAASNVPPPPPPPKQPTVEDFAKWAYEVTETFHTIGVAATNVPPPPPPPRK